MLHAIIEVNNNIPGVLGLLKNILLEIGRNDLQEKVFDFLVYPLRGLFLQFTLYDF